MRAEIPPGRRKRCEVRIEPTSSRHDSILRAVGAGGLSKTDRSVGTSHEKPPPRPHRPYRQLRRTLLFLPDFNRRFRNFTGPARDTTGLSDRLMPPLADCTADREFHPSLSSERILRTNPRFCQESALTNSQPPIYVAACQQRALDFGPIDELREKYVDDGMIAPLADTALTHPNLITRALSYKVPAPVKKHGTPTWEMQH